ncbi:hypothetical protein SAMN05421640_2971 [Ekhidna lutea]|uniref:Outer membrane protein beta-barrel domain-containing protein n=1 Tax=Ekhidna lutea TaxID=447679 RepID=A0A239L4Z2_EKHLU|nr:hypothetical protein [Ekhidna lutea]SNT25380.1 hypothetical protein SAMN05421640_2971 [Ekhidna lutea]
MKKLLLVSLMIFLTSIVYAQDDSGGTSPTSGELLIEITSSPFGRDGNTYSSSSNNTLLNFGQFRARYFLDETLVPRLGIWFSIDDNRDGMTTPDATETISQFMFTPGIEYHFTNEGGFTSYAALDVILSGRSVKRISETDSDISGALPSGDVSSITDPNQSFSFQNRGYFGIGAMGAVGADYHFSSRFYMGAEIGFYFITGKSSDVEIDGALYQEGIKFFESGVKTSNSFRIGFKLLN